LSVRVQITEYLDIDLATEMWHCNRCSQNLGSAHRSYKEGCLMAERDPHEIHAPVGKNPEYNFSFDPTWIRIIEFYCPQCATMVENEYLPPGHPLTWDIQLDLEDVKRRHGFTA
jgi:acetone carboxylase gamma subunit